MKMLKEIGQVLAAIIYTCLFTGLIYLITVLPVAWLMSLSTKMMILVLLLIGGLLQGVIFGLQVLLMMPFYWIVKNNLVALIISIGLTVFNLVANDVRVWQSVAGQGGAAIVAGVIITGLIVEVLFMSIYGVIAAYHNE